MPKFKNVSPSGDLDLPLVGRVVKAGEVIAVSVEQGDLLAVQPDVWALVVEEKK